MLRYFRVVRHTIITSKARLHSSTPAGRHSALVIPALSMRRKQAPLGRPLYGPQGYSAGFMLTAIALAVVGVLGWLWTAQASGSSFCEQRVVRDYAKPLRQMPSLRSVSAGHKLSFGPHGVYLRSLSHSQILLPESHERVGYSLRVLKSGNPDLPRLNWLITAKLARVDSQGRLRRLLESRRRHIAGAGYNGSFGFESPRRLGSYRLEIIFRDSAGRSLGRFGSYFRVVPSVQDARLTLDAASYQPGETVSACLENFGTTGIGSGTCGISIETFEGTAWSRAGFSPPGECPADLALLRPGRTARAGSFELPTDAPAGTYRAVLPGTSFSAEFHIVPPTS